MYSKKLNWRQKINNILNYLNNSKLFLQVVAEKITLKAKRSGKSFKEYIHDDENIGHISLVVYDLLPLPFKFALRYEKFNTMFTSKFSFIRGKLFTVEQASLDSNVKKLKPVAVKKVLKKKVSLVVKPAVAKKTTPPPDVPKKIMPKPVIAKKTTAKPVPAKKTIIKKPATKKAMPKK